MTGLSVTTTVMTVMALTRGFMVHHKPTQIPTLRMLLTKLNAVLFGAM